MSLSSLVNGADEARHEDGSDDNEDGEAGDALRPEVAHRSVAVPAIKSGNSNCRCTGISVWLLSPFGFVMKESSQWIT